MKNIVVFRWLHTFMLSMVEQINSPSPHAPCPFIMSGLFSTGTALARLGKFYAAAIVSVRPVLHFDIIFGPAYKV